MLNDWRFKSKKNKVVLKVKNRNQVEESKIFQGRNLFAPPPF
jgi:hypothetical protein